MKNINKMLVLFMILLLITACSSNNKIRHDLRNNALPIVEIYHDFLSGNSEGITEKDHRKISYFFDKYSDIETSGKYNQSEIELIQNLTLLDLDASAYEEFHDGGDESEVKERYNMAIASEKEINKLLE